MTKYPTIARIDKALSEIPAFKKAHPSVQPDANKSILNNVCMYTCTKCNMKAV